jgi:hypothetical protein
MEKVCGPEPACIEMAVHEDVHEYFLPNPFFLRMFRSHSLCYNSVIK